MRTDDNLYNFDFDEIRKITLAAIEKHPERTDEILNDFYKMCRRNHKHIEDIMIMKGENNMKKVGYIIRDEQLGLYVISIENFNKNILPKGLKGNWVLEEEIWKDEKDIIEYRRIEKE